MRIAILVPNFAEYDGAARVAEVQANKLVREGNQVDIYTFASEIPPNGFRIFVMGMPKSLFWQRIYRLFFPLDLFKVIRWLPKLKNYDEIIVHLYPLTWLGFLAKKFYKVKYTFWYHGIMPPNIFQHFWEKLYMKLFIILTKVTIKNSDRLVAVSRYGREELRKYIGKNDIEVIYNEINLEKFKPGLDGKKIREKHKIGYDPLILFVGTLRPTKGVHFLIHAFKLIKNEIPNAKLLIVGRADYPYYFEELKRISDSSVIFAGFVPREELPYYYAACDIYATCSIWETYHLPAAEAQACGKPVIAWHESIKEIINDKGSIVEMGNIEEFAKACIEKLRDKPVI
ncbi:MAG: glycosyltransferase family 4 protein [Leptospiraceae bacterium]|nr:glycosyltransferase family 4 protein [Leptospiraceae bacterium]